MIYDITYRYDISTTAFDYFVEPSPNNFSYRYFLHGLECSLEVKCEKVCTEKRAVLIDPLTNNPSHCVSPICFKPARTPTHVIV